MEEYSGLEEYIEEWRNRERHRVLPLNPVNDAIRSEETFCENHDCSATGDLDTCCQETPEDVIIRGYTADEAMHCTIKSVHILMNQSSNLPLCWLSISDHVVLRSPVSLPHLGQF